MYTFPAASAPTAINESWIIDAGGFRNLSTALASPSTVGKTVVISKPMSINNMTTDRAISVTSDGKINVAIGNVLAINGPFSAGPYQVFGGGGLVTGLHKITTGVLSQWWGVKADGLTDDTVAVQMAINCLANRPAPYTGGYVNLPSGIIRASGIILKNRVYLQGQGRGATIVLAPDRSNNNMLTIPADACLIGWSGITFDGNAANQTVGSGIVFDSVGSSAGNSFAPYMQKVDSALNSYKHCMAYDFTVGNFKDDGVKTSSSNYQIFFDNFVCSHNGRDGLAVFSSDGIYTNFYIEKNGRSGLWASGASNKFSIGKVIWNGRTNNTYGGLREQGTRNVFVNVEAQDNYTDGILILGNSPRFVGCSSNTNGYMALGDEGRSSGKHADIRVGSSANNISFSGAVYSYKTKVGTDGLWTTKWPYYFNAYNSGQILEWDVMFDQTKYNASPNYSLHQLIKGTLGDIEIFSSNGVDTYLDVNPKSLTGVGNKIMRNWRNSDITGNCTESWYVPGTAAEQHRVTGAGDTLLNQSIGNVVVGNASAGGTWNSGHLRLGIHHLWIDDSGRLRTKKSAPTSDTDGTVIGSQL